MTPAIYTIMMRFNFRQTNNDAKTQTQLPDSNRPIHLATPHHEPISRNVFDGIRNVMQLKQSGMCGSCK
jgi:hypothetical protein